MNPNNPNQFTEKAWQAISRTPDIAKTAQNQQIDTEHLMKALLEQNGLATSLLTKQVSQRLKSKDIQTLLLMVNLKSKTH